MKNTALVLLHLLLFLASCATKEVIKVVIQSPDQKIQVTVDLIAQEVFYKVAFHDKPVINASKLGFEFKNQAALSKNMKITNVLKTSFDENWEQVWGERKVIKNQYNQAVVQLQETTGLQRKLNLTFRLFNDGLGFSYEIPAQKGIDSLYITHELTEFNLAQNYATWFIPANFDSYEALYQNKPADQVKSANTPITFEASDQSLFLSIHEANLSNYAGMTLQKSAASPLKFEANLVPWPDSVKVKTKAPMKTPWRTIQIADAASKLMESSLILNLNEPNTLKDVSWIHPTKYIGIWWGMHLGTQTWTLGERHGATTENLKKYIDFAAKNNFHSVLAEGWNTGWEKWGQPKAFDFVTAYEDFNLREVAQYAQQKGIKIIGHHETGGDSKYYEEQMEKAFKLYQSLGIHQVKTGYAGPIVPRKQWHHGQYMVNHYRKVVETAARYQITINAHEPIKPTGVRRTYPNMMSREGARGMEWNAWSDGNPPAHHTILPFTRILAGPLDYTPGVFDLLYKKAGKRVKWNGLDKGNGRIYTTLAKQLALFVVFYSPVQMASDLIENYENQPAFKFIREVPVNWQDTKVINAKIGDFVTVARKDIASSDWFLGAVTDENGRTLKIPLDFLDPDKTYIAEIYQDAPDSHWKSNPYPLNMATKTVTSHDQLTLKLAPGGGQAIHFRAK